MGLLDAEGYKFLEASDSNSDREDDDDIVMDHIADASILALRGIDAGFHILANDADAAGAHDSQEPSSSEIIYEMRPAPMQQ